MLRLEHISGTITKDSNKHSQEYMLKTFDHGHLFPDILDLTTASSVAKDTAIDNAMKTELIRHQSKLFPSAFCLRHQSLCPLQGPDCDGSGSPCLDFTRAGNQLGLEGPTLPCFLTWARFHEWWGTKLILHENVLAFPVEFARQSLPSFQLYVFKVKPKHCGFTHVERTRQYFVGVHKRNAVLTRDIYKVWQDVTEAMAIPDLTPEHAIFASPQEIRNEELDICRTRGLTAKPFTDAPDLAYTLSQAEHTSVCHLDTLYMIKTGQRPESNKWLAYNLTDNALNRISWTLTSQTLPTLRRNCNRIWFPAYRRCLTRSERLAMMGFPSNAILADSCGASTQTTLTKSEQGFLLGNAMHLPTASIMFALALACTQQVN